MKPKIYQAELRLLNDSEVLDKTNGIPLEERLPDNAKCEICGNNEWFIHPVQSAGVREGGKYYCECLNCGELTHLQTLIKMIYYVKYHKGEYYIREKGIENYYSKGLILKRNVDRFFKDLNNKPLKFPNLFSASQWCMFKMTI